MSPALSQPYVDIEYVALLGNVPSSQLYAYEESNPGTFLAIATAVSRMFDQRLSKRYKVPFDLVNPPEALRFHIAQVVSFQIWLKMGFNPGSLQDEALQTAKTEALDWLKEAADSKDGTIELPLRDADPAPPQSAIARGYPLSYSEASPFAWVSRQRDAVRNGR